jgi:uncharacterized glyoxalase superfamily protein PhnB
MLASVCPKLPMVDGEATRLFYSSTLGFEVLADYGDYLLMQREGVELHFFSYPTLEPARSDFMAYVRVEGDIKPLYEEIAARGATPEQLRPLETKPWGMREFSVVDPSGTCLTFGERL